MLQKMALKIVELICSIDNCHNNMEWNYLTTSSNKEIEESFSNLVALKHV